MILANKKYDKMMRKKTKNGILFILLLYLTNVNAQQATTAAGGDASGSGGIVAYSIGQVVYSANFGTGGSVNQGVEQVYEIILLGTNEEILDVFMNVYPNPTTNNLTLEVPEYMDKQLVYQVFDIQGRLLENDKIVDSYTQINTSAYSPATYFLKVIQENNLVQTFKFIKN